MGRKTAIEWCDATFNPWYGCQRVSLGCDHCYAERLGYRMGVAWGAGSRRVPASDGIWEQPLRWARAAGQRGIRPRVFCASMSDVFDNAVPPEWRRRLWELIQATPELDWLILTKRPENMDGMLPDSWNSRLGWPNVWLGISAEDQERFDHRWPILLRTGAAIRFVSYEPALGPLDLIGHGWHRGLDWLICGGESGPGYRPMDPMWEGWIREQCRILGVAYFFKQLAGKKPISPDFPLVRQFPTRIEVEPQYDMFEEGAECR